MNSLTSSIAFSAIVPTFYGKRAWPGCPSKKQDWGYPESMIHYIAKNPSSAKVYQKMIQSCKYFFEKNPVLVVSKLAACCDNVNSLICSNTFDECMKNNGECCVKINVAKVSSEIWIADQLAVFLGAENFTSVLCSKLYRCEINRLLIGDKVIICDDLQLLTSSAKAVTLWENKITFNDGKPVMLDNILECFSNVEEFDFNFENDDVTMVNVSTMKTIMKLKNLGKIEYFRLGNLPEPLSIEDISAFFKKYEHVKTAFHFNENITDDFKNQLDGLIDEIIESEIPNRLIEYDGQDEGKLKIMESRFVF